MSPTDTPVHTVGYPMENHIEETPFENDYTVPTHDPALEIPPTVDPERPPVRNDDNKSFHSGCSCLLCASIETDGCTDLESEAFGLTMSESMTAETSSEYGEEPVNGAEGPEGHLIEIEGHGYIPFTVIYRSLARHRGCTCHHGVLPEEYPFDTYRPPSPYSPGTSSMMVELGSSNEASMASSTFGLYSRNSSLFNNIGEPFALEPFPILWTPLRLTPELGCQYPMELSFSSGE